jgi:myo-inositol-1(or 4)-monophosphatase
MNDAPHLDLADLRDLRPEAALLIEAARAAGALALRYFRKANDVQLKADGSQVSEADLAVDAELRRRLMGARPGYGWLSEETPDTDARFAAPRVFIVDPIDGTRAFVEGKDEWTICAGLVRTGAPIASVVYNPARRELFDAIQGEGARLNGRPIRVTDRADTEGALFLGSAGLYRPTRWKDPWPRIHVRWTSSIAYRMALVAAGRADATMSLGTYADWDLAAAALIVTEAGGRVSDRTGKELRFNAPMPYHAGLVAGAPAIHADMIARLRCRIPPQT